MQNRETLFRARIRRAACKTAAVLPAGAESRVVVTLSPRQRRQAWEHIDGWILAAVASVTLLYAGAVHVRLDPRFFAVPAGNDVWFEGDGPIVADLIVHRWSEQS